MVWDLRRSGVNPKIKPGERIVLPKLRHVVDDALDLLSKCERNEDVILFGIDIADAFHQVPLRPDEKKFCCTTSGGKFYVYEVLTFGASSFPTIWGRYAAFLGRSLAALLPADRARLYICG